MAAVTPRKKEHHGGVSLPADIIFDVLARVPAKALCQFRCVCKGWRNLISDPAFVAAQSSHTGPHLVGVFFGAWRSLPAEVRVMDMEGNVVRVFQVRVLGKYDGNDVLGVLRQSATRLDLMCVTDPCTFVSDAMIIDLVAGRAYTVRAIDNPLDMPCFGGTDPSGNFKVIRLNDTLLCTICNVSTILDGGLDEPLTWRQRSAPPFLTSSDSQQTATVNGVIYIMARINMHDAAPKSGSSRIAAFNLDSEEWKMTNGPAFGIQDETGYLTLTELRGTLGLLQRLSNDDHYYYCAIIWRLIDFNKSLWVKEYTIHMPKGWSLIKQLGALDDGRILLLVSDCAKKNQISCRHRDVLVFYSPSTKSFTELREIHVGFFDTLVLYTGSLLS